MEKLVNNSNLLNEKGMDYTCKAGDRYFNGETNENG